MLAILRHPFLVVGGIVWLGAISTYATSAAWNFDSGLYHIPAIRWIADYRLPLGLGNLHGRLGFDSAWFPLSALFAQITAPHTPNYTALASEVFLAVYGLAVLRGIVEFFQGDRSLSTLLLMLLGAVGFRQRSRKIFLPPPPTILFCSSRSCSFIWHFECWKPHGSLRHAIICFYYAY